MIRASVVGGSGYAGGELLRLLLGHPDVSLRQAASTSEAGQYVHMLHPNLRGHTDLRFVPPAAIEECDVLFLAMPHGAAGPEITRWASLGERVIDLSADFRLRDAVASERWYGPSAVTPEWRERFVYGLPEAHRAELAGAAYASGVGCNATAVILALLPLARRELIETAVVEVKVGSSEGGRRASAATHHAERAGALRSFAPTGHRHQAEMHQELGESFALHFSATAVEMVRGILCTAHVFPREGLSEAEVWGMYREDYGAEPFVRLVKSRRGIHRYPEPKLLAGSNHCDVGFAMDEESGRLVVLSAIDNLMKGAAGTAVQAMNVLCGLPETAGLGFPGLHPC